MTCDTFYTKPLPVEIVFFDFSVRQQCDGVFEYMCAVFVCVCDCVRKGMQQRLGPTQGLAVLQVSG